MAQDLALATAYIDLRVRGQSGVDASLNAYRQKTQNLVDSAKSWRDYMSTPMGTRAVQDQMRASREFAAAAKEMRQVQLVAQHGSIVGRLAYRGEQAAPAMMALGRAAVAASASILAMSRNMPAMQAIGGWVSVFAQTLNRDATPALMWFAQKVRQVTEWWNNLPKPVREYGASGLVAGGTALGLGMAARAAGLGGVVGGMAGGLWRGAQWMGGRMLGVAAAGAAGQSALSSAANFIGGVGAGTAGRAAGFGAGALGLGAAAGAAYLTYKSQDPTNSKMEQFLSRTGHGATYGALASLPFGGPTTPWGAAITGAGAVIGAGVGAYEAYTNKNLISGQQLGQREAATKNLRVAGRPPGPNAQFMDPADIWKHVMLQSVNAQPWEMEQIKLERDQYQMMVQIEMNTRELKQEAQRARGLR